jgi:hypothetical protein
VFRTSVRLPSDRPICAENVAKRSQSWRSTINAPSAADHLTGQEAWQAVHNLPDDRLPSSVRVWLPIALSRRTLPAGAWTSLVAWQMLAAVRGHRNCRPRRTGTATVSAPASGRDWTVGDAPPAAPDVDTCWSVVKSGVVGETTWELDADVG